MRKGPFILDSAFLSLNVLAAFFVAPINIIGVFGALFIPFVLIYYLVYFEPREVPERPILIPIPQECPYCGAGTIIDGICEYCKIDLKKEK